MVANLIMLEKPHGVAGVLAGNARRLGQDIKRTMGDVAEIADGSGDEVESRFQSAPLLLLWRGQGRGVVCHERRSV